MNALEAQLARTEGAKKDIEFKVSQLARTGGVKKDIEFKVSPWHLLQRGGSGSLQKRDLCR